MGKLKQLQKKWGLGPVQFWLVMLTFALGGSLSGRLCTKILDLAFLERNWSFWLIYPLFLTILWPFSVLFVSFFTGQFSFFKGYLGRVGAKLFGYNGANSSSHSPSDRFNNFNATIHIAIFASGTGSNARKIIEHFEGADAQPGAKTQTRIKVSLIVCNVPTAGVLNIAKEKGIPTLLINKDEFASTGYVDSLRNADIEFIVLAGFLWKVPQVLVHAFQPGNGKAKGIINIHPALLPKYGGKGMYGANVHKAVIAAGETESGITIHWVNEHYDEGAIIYQAKCTINAGDTADTLADKIHALEHAHFAPTIEKLLLK
jgi:folate-dependent phosphoribosylglycinamide formyltransferase PurN